MLEAKWLSLYFWAKDITCAKYIVNHTPTKALKDITLEKTWSKIKLDVSDFSVHGSESRDHIPDEKWKELQHTSERFHMFVIADFTTLGESHFVWPSPVPLQTP